MVCTFCGKQLPEGGRFCTFCGRQLVSETEETKRGNDNVAGTAENKKITLSSAEAGKRAPAVNAAQAGKGTAKAKGKLRRLVIALAVTAIVLAALAYPIISGMHFKCPIPYFNKTFGRYVPDYRGVYIGMSYDDVLEALRGRVAGIEGDTENCYIFSQVRVKVLRYETQYEACVIKDGKLTAVYFYFVPYIHPSQIMLACSDVRKYYEGLYCVGKNEDMNSLFMRTSVDIVDFDSCFSVYFTEPIPQKIKLN